MINNIIKKKMYKSHINQDILTQIKYLNIEIKFIEDEMNYWNYENEIQPSEITKNIINKLSNELNSLKNIYSMVLSLSEKN